jgi:hypothetical protein
VFVYIHPWQIQSNYVEHRTVRGATEFSDLKKKTQSIVILVVAYFGNFCCCDELSPFFIIFGGLLYYDVASFPLL